MVPHNFKTPSRYGLLKHYSPSQGCAKGCSLKTNTEQLSILSRWRDGQRKGYIPIHGGLVV